jgi:hypothetical protein
MKLRNLLVAPLRLVAAATVVLSFMGVSGVQAAALPNQITVSSQDINTGVIVVHSVTAAADGWVVIYDGPQFYDGQIVGYAPVYQGANTDVRVTVNTSRIGDRSTLWARLHVDQGAPGVFEWGRSNLPYADAPVVQNGQYVTAAFGTSAAAPAAASTNQISVDSQDISSGVIVVRSVTAAADGWIVIYDGPDFSDGEIVGHAPVYQGVNTDVKVTLNSRLVSTDHPTLWARLHVDAGVTGLFEWGRTDMPYADMPVVQNGQYVTAAFGTTGASSIGAGTNQITVSSQNINTGIIEIQSVTAAADGWVVIYDGPQFYDSQLVGYAPVYQGTNTDVKVTVDTNRIGEQPTLWARLHVDQGVKGLFEWGRNNLPYDDAPVMQNSQPVVAAFGTTAP